MKKLLLLLLILLVVTPTMWAQEKEMYVASFERFDNDMTARVKAPVIDQNGRKTALIKIETPLRGLVVEGGMLGITETRQETGELWVYLPHGTVRFTLKHNDFGVLRNYEFPEPIVEATTYVLKLVHTGKVVNYIEEVETNQYFILNYTPADAVVDLYVDEAYAKQGSEGSVSLKLSPGKHTYRLESIGYKNTAGVVTIGAERVTATTSLLSSRGKLAITTIPASGAQLYIDGKLIGVSPLTTESYEAGSYPLTVKLAQYMPYTQQVVFPSEDKVENLTIDLSPNYADITITTDEKSDIYLNEEHKGKGSHTQRLTPGLYTLEARRTSHRSTKKSIEVVAGVAQQITLDAPTPIYGSLDVMTTPANAAVYLNDTPIGTAPDVFSQLLIGSYTMRIEKEGYQTYTSTITLTEGKITDYIVDLKKDDAEELYTQANALYDAKNYAEALPLLMRAVEQEYAPAQNLMGLFYEYGNGVTKDYVEAVKWYRKSAEQGYARSQFNLGICYDNGRGVAKDYVEAAKWYLKAAEQGHSSAQSNLGYSYENGEGVTKNINEAINWYRKAAKQGNSNAQAALKRLGVEQE